jgi:starch phosphorylase
LKGGLGFLPDSRIAYFSMEIGLQSAIPTYSGGLGVLAGDTIRAAADRELPLVAVTLLHRKGYFRQELDSKGEQKNLPEKWEVQKHLREMPERASVRIEGRTVQLRCWKYEARGVRGYPVPVYFLDSDLAENSNWDKKLSHYLYGGDDRYRFSQEVILGIGGIRMLRALGYDRLERYHMNEGHSSLLTVELLEERLRSRAEKTTTDEDIEAIRSQCVFTTHTPVAAGHDRFPLDLVRKVLDKVNLTYLALKLSQYVNGVARKHKEVSQQMFDGYQIDSITNGVHAATWTAPPMQELFDRHIPGWREDASSLRYASSIPHGEIWESHLKAKTALVDSISRVSQETFDAEAFTIGFARRATAYKRADLLFHDLERLARLASKFGPLQLVYAGKAHPRDEHGKALIRNIFAVKERLKEPLRLVYLEGYDMDLGRLITSGVDLWLNTPQPPLEASGTSGMKAALNGVPSLSILDGWWIEGHIEGVTGWAIGEDGRHATEGDQRPKDARSLYDKLEKVILPLFHREKDRYIEVMCQAMSLNGSFFNAARMLSEYVHKAYWRAG